MYLIHIMCWYTNMMILEMGSWYFEKCIVVAVVPHLLNEKTEATKQDSV